MAAAAPSAAAVEAAAQRTASSRQAPHFHLQRHLDLPISHLSPSPFFQLRGVPRVTSVTTRVPLPG